MLGKLNSYLIIFLCLGKILTISAERRTETILFLRDFMLHEKDSAFLVGFLCWEKDSITKLIKTMNIKSISVNIMQDCKPEDFQRINHRILFVLDITCPFAEKCLKMANSVKLFNSPYKWVMLDHITEENEWYHPSFSTSKTNDNGYSMNQDSKSNVTNVENGNHCVADKHAKTLQRCPQYYFSDKMLYSDSNVVIAIQKKHQKSIFLIQYYKRRMHSVIIQEEYGLWSKTSGIVDKRSKRNLAMRRLNTQKTTVTASFVILNKDTLNHLTDYRDKHIDTITKVNYALTSHLMDFVNATHNSTFVDNWGYRGPDGQWSGMIGQMIRLEADIGDRISIIEYIAMTTPTVAMFVFRRPPLSYVSNIFVLPFQWTVWVAILFTLILASCALYLIANWEQKTSPPVETCPYCGVDEERNDRIPGKWGDVCLLAIGAMAQQGSVNESRSLSGRITTVVLFITLMFFYTSYSANIVALLQSQSENIKTLSDLLYSRIKIGADDTVYNRYYFPLYTEPVRQAIYTQKMAPKGSKPHFYSLTEGVEKIRKGMFAFHMEIGVGYKIVSDTFQEDEKCGLDEIQFFQTINPWYAIQKMSSFKEMFKIGMRRIQEYGLASREVQKLYTKRPTCSSSGGGFVSVGLVEVKPALVSLASALSIAVLVFIIEKLYSIRDAYVHQHYH